MIYFVDEDIGEQSALVLALRLRGLDVTTVPDATTALRVFEQGAEASLVVLDVMLAAGTDERFGPAKTNGGLTTGLSLLELLCESRPDIFPARSVLLSASTDERVTAQISSVARARMVPYWQKHDIKSVSQFADKVKALIAEVGEGT